MLFMEFYLSKKFIFLLIISLTYIYIIIHHNFLNLKVCVCTVGKNENRYVREFVEHYKKYEVDNIFIYDNNDINGENFDIVLKDYIRSGFIKIINIRGKIKMQFPAFNHCYQENKKIYDWLIFYDMDEFIHLANVNNIKRYLNKKQFHKCNVIYLNEYMHTDNDQIYYYNKSLYERFPNATLNFSKEIGFTKMILRGSLEKINITNPHILITKNQCNSVGKVLKSLKTEYFYNNNYYIDHFYFKSPEEFLGKLKKGSVASGKKKGSIKQWIQFYFSVNKITEDKLDFFENKTGIKLNVFRDKINQIIKT